LRLGWKRAKLPSEDGGRNVPSVPDDEEAKRARKLYGEVLRTFAEVADDTSAPQAVREKAVSELTMKLGHLKAIKNDPNTPTDVLEDVEEAFRKFLSS
jgi:hypothetical protein